MVSTPEVYNPRDWGGEREAILQAKYRLQRDDARLYFESCIKPRLDRSYKLASAFNGDRAKELRALGQTWKSNVFVPYILGVIETLMPRILDARPDFIAQGRTEDDQFKAEKLQQLMDFTWEKAGMDAVSEALCRSALVYGMGFLHVSWKSDIRTQKFLKSKDLSRKKLNWEDRTVTFYDAPFAEALDPYSLWYDWHNVPRKSKQYWFRRLLLNGEEIRRRYPYADPARLDLALRVRSGILEDYAKVRNEVKLTQTQINKGSDMNMSSFGDASNRYQTLRDFNLRFHEVFEWWRPLDDEYAVMVNDVPILKGGAIPMPYDFKEAPFIDLPYLRMPFEFEGLGLPMLLENSQILLNTIKNQRVDGTTLGIHKMWIVNPLANIDNRELVTRPFGIIYSTDPNGVREVQFSDIKASAYREEDLIKGDMRYASGVDDLSMGAGGGVGAGGATEVRHLRESTLERVRLFVNHLGDTYSELMRWWISMYGQFFTKAMTIRVVKDGSITFPLIQKDDVMGEFDFQAAVLPSISGKNDIDKKQGMDLFQLLANQPFVDLKKLTGKILHSWNWSLESISKADDQSMLPPGAMPPDGSQPGVPGMPGQQPPAGPPPAGGMPPSLAALMGQGAPGAAPTGPGAIPPGLLQSVIATLGAKKGQPAGPSPFAEASSPINLTQGGAMPPTAPGIPTGQTSNPRGLNRSAHGKVNTNVPTKGGSSAADNIASQASNIQS